MNTNAQSFFYAVSIATQKYKDALADNRTLTSEIITLRVSVERMTAVLVKLNRLGGLGRDKHEWIDAALYAQAPTAAPVAVHDMLIEALRDWANAYPDLGDPHDNHTRGRFQISECAGCRAESKLLKIAQELSDTVRA